MTTIDLSTVREAALDLALATWYDEALGLLDATTPATGDAEGRVLLALTAADVADRADHVFGRTEAPKRFETLDAELAAFLDAGAASGPQARLEGAKVALPAGAAQPLAMALHELATNAVKYGALSRPAGRVSVSWRLEGGPAGVLRLRWTEACGPPVPGPPTRRGFGLRLLERALARQLGGEVALDYPAAGFAFRLRLPLNRRVSLA